MNGSDYARIEKAIRFLDAQARTQPSLEELARHLGLSLFYCQRLFHRWAGLTPKDFLRVTTLGYAKELLRRSHSVLDAALEAGLSGPGRLYDLFLSIETMTPGEFRQGGAGITVRWGLHETPVGRALFASTERGLCALHFAGGDEAAAELRKEWPRATLRREPAATAGAAREVSARMRGRTTEPLSILFRGTPFQIRVWQALLAIPAGALATYGQISAGIGQPKANRAVGSAIGANPLAFLIPCHRVLRSTGALGGYRWDETRKRALLAMERAW